ncbi:hypothetical protein [Niabella aquatica]
MKILLPEHLTIADIHADGYDSIQNYAENKMLRFISLFQELCMRGYYFLGKDEVEIYSPILQRISKDYVAYVALLEDVKVLKVNHYYMPEIGCKKYSYALLYAEKYFLHKIERKKIGKFIYDINYKGKKELKNNFENRLNELFCFLDFDVDRALAYSDQLKKKRIATPEINPTAKVWLQTSTGKWYKGTEPSPKDVEEQHKYELWQIDKWEDQVFDGKRDITGYRFHSLLTRLPKDFKQFVRFGGAKENLFSLDIKNSQPFFSLIVMNPTFWYCPDMTEDYKKVYRRYFGELADHSQINLQTIGMENAFSAAKYTYIIKCISKLGADYTLYKEKILSGKLYEGMQEHYQQTLQVSLRRDEVKTSLFTTIFSSNKFMGQKDARPKKLFSQIFPSVYKVIAAIKKGEKYFQESSITDKPYKLFSIMLQRIESHVVLDNIVSKLINKYPNMPVYTIHDSICSTERHMPLIKQIFEETIFTTTGLTPKFSFECWQKNIENEE